MDGCGVVSSRTEVGAQKRQALADVGAGLEQERAARVAVAAAGAGARGLGVVDSC